jgi:hypothetical protein
VLSIFARGAAGALERPAFPAPSFFEGREIAKLGRNWRRENAGRCEPIPMLGRPTGDEIELSAERDLRWRANDCASQLQLSRERNSGLPEARFPLS